ncbi:response regulator [Deltaproteobacteria bacterium OttesenSCG-928-K17]|nr:response regulator [Deltaproteobacteria bacterium OttesenSCG-928-K17]
MTCDKNGNLSAQEAGYLKRMSEHTVARLLKADFTAITMRQELEQKRRGFRLMADLAVALSPGTDYLSVFISVSRRVNAALNMQRTAVLTPDKNGLFQPVVLQGYPAEDIERIENQSLKLDPGMLDPEKPVLITGADPDDFMADLRGLLDLPYLISSPVMLNKEVAAVLVTGRQVEQPPFLPRLGQSDLETVQTVSSYLAAMLTGLKLEAQEHRTHDLQEVMRTVFQASVDGYVVWDNGRIRQVSPGALNLFGLDSADEFDRDHQSYGITDQHLERMFKKALAEGRVREEVFLRRKNGDMLPAEVTHLPLILSSGACLLSYVRDLTEQKKTESDLRAAKEAAEVAARAKSEFLANMSHEIRTPLNAIKGFAHLLEQSPLNENQTAYLDRIHDSFDALLRIVNDVLDFSMIDSGRLKIEPAEFSLTDVISSVLNLHQDAAADKGLTLTIEGEPPDVELIGDAQRLKQILNNLVDNAIKFTEKGGILIKVEPGPPLDSADNLTACTFTVRDTGIGLDSQNVSNLFAAFSQADTSFTRKYGGTGLGLAISSRLAEMMGGRMWVESEPGRGSAFYFTAAFEKAAPKENKAAARQRPNLNSLAGDIKGARILLVEDNEVNQAVASKIMEKAGLSVTVAENGVKALEALEADEYDLVLMDVQMPEMDGLEATRRIRADARYNDLPILAMTAHAMQTDREASLSVGMNDHITKPINLSVLFDSLKKWINRPK